MAEVTEGGARLDAWLEGKSIAEKKALRVACGVSRTQIWRYCHAGAMPDAQKAYQIELATRGEVPVSAWSRKGKPSFHGEAEP